MRSLLSEIKQCQLCSPYLKVGANLVLSVSARSNIAIIGQAPGRIVHQTNIPWDDKSGERLRQWLGINQETFYDNKIFALVPMGFCYPGKGASGDLPPRKECAPLWHGQLFKEISNIKLMVLIGRYSQSYYLKENNKKTLTETVENFREYMPKYMTLPHPSPRNNIWLKKNPWFERKVIPILQERVKGIIG